MYEELFQTAIIAALTPRWQAYSNEPPRLIWDVLVDVALPRAIIQMQSDPLPAHRIKSGGATFIITLKAQATSRSTARALLNALAPLDSYGVPVLPTLTIPNFSVGTQWTNSPLIPFDSKVYQPAHSFRVTMRHTPS